VSSLEQRTAALWVAVILGLTILTLLAAPLTWRRVLLIGAMIAIYVLVFPVPGIRKFFALELPSHSIWILALTAAAGVILLVAIWFALRHERRTR